MKAQGATEYLVNLAVALFIATIVIGAMLWPNSSTPDVKRTQTDTKFKINVMKCSDIMSSTPCPDLLNGLVAYYKFDEGGGTSTVNGKGGADGTLANGTAWTDGKSGKALSFDGVDDYADSNRDYSWGVNGSFTVSYWIYPISVSGARGIFGKVAPNWEWGTYTSGSNLYFYYSNTTGANLIIQLISSVSANNWTHIAVTYGNNQASIYKNGVLGQTQSGRSGVFKDNSGTVIFGRDYLGVNYFGGRLDEVLIYNRALSAEEVRLLYENPGYPQ